MTIEVALLISGISLVFGLYQGVANLKRNSHIDVKKDASEMTTVIVKLENIGNDISDIKNELSSVKQDMKDVIERIVKVEESSKSAHRRLDTCEKYCKKLRDYRENE